MSLISSLNMKLIANKISKITLMLTILVCLAHANEEVNKSSNPGPNPGWEAVMA